MKIIFPFIFILLINIKDLFILAQSTSECGLRCLTCNFDKICSLCQDGFALSDETKKCRQVLCDENKYLFEQTKTCIEICPSSYLADDVYRICIQLPDCPSLDQRGQNYFDSFSNAIMTDKWIITYGRMQQDNDYSLKMFIRQDMKYKGDMLGHSSEIFGMVPTKQFNVKTQQYDNELITFSASELIIWNTDYGYIRNKFTFDKNLKGSSMFYLDQDILILNLNVYQFGIVFLNLKSNIASSITSNITSETLENEQNKISNYDSTAADSDESDYQNYLDQNIPEATNIYSFIINQFHQQVLKGYFRVGDYLYSYAFDSIIAKYDLKQLGSTSGVLVCQFPSNLIITSININAQNNIFFTFQDSLSIGLLITATNKCLVVDQSTYHQYSITSIKLDSSQSALFTVSSSRAIFSSYTINQADQNNPIVQLNMIQQINIEEKSSIFVQSNYFIMVKARGYILISLIQGQEQLLEKYTYDLQYDSDIALSQVIIDTDNNKILLFATELISLTMNADVSQLFISDRQKNILKTQPFHLSRVNGFLFDDLYGRVITYSKDGMIYVYSPTSIYQSDTNTNTTAWDIRKRNSLSGYQIVTNALHPSCTMEQYRSLTCPRSVVKMLKVRNDLFAAQYDDNTIYMWNYSLYALTLAKVLQPTDTKATFINMYAMGTNFAFCNSKEMSIYKVDTYTLVKKYANTFDYCAMDQITSVDHIIFIKNSAKAAYVIQVSNLSNKYSYTFAGVTSSPPQYYPTVKQLIFSTTNSNIYFLTFPTLSTSVVKSTVVTPLTFAINTVTFNSFVFSNNLNMSYFTSKTTLVRAFKTLNAFSDGQAILVSSSPEIFAYYQNTGLNSIQNQVFIVGSNFDYKMILTFTDKISSIKADTNGQRIFIGFENGFVKVGNIDTKSLVNDDMTAFTSLEIDKKSNLMFAYKSEIHVYDQILLTKKLILNSIHDPAINLSGILISSSKMTLLSYNVALSNNLVKWNLITGIGAPITVPHTLPLISTYLDDVRDIFITIAQDLQMIQWRFSNNTLINTFTNHISRRDQLAIDEASLDPDQKTVYTIVYTLFDASCNKLISTNNIGEVYLTDYVTKNTYSVTLSQIANIYQDTVYQRIIVLAIEDYWYKLYAYTYTNILDQISISYPHDPKVRMKGAIFQNNYMFTYEDNKIMIMNRVDYSLIQKIECPNPLISNFIVYEKLNQVIIWSDFTTGYTNTNLGIYDLITGLKITDIIKQQAIEDGFIHKVLVDEDKYTLIVSKSGTNNFIFTIDLRTFYYTGYYTASFNTQINSFKIDPNTSQLYVVDATNFRAYNYETVTYNMNQFFQISEFKNYQTFYNDQENSIYYFDANSQGWEFQIDTKQVKNIEYIAGIKLAKFWQEYLYVVSQNSLLKFTKKMVLVGKIDYQSIQVYFSINYIFFTSFDVKLYQISLNGFKITAFTKTLEDGLTDLVAVEQYQEVIISLANKRIYRYSMTTGNQIIWYDTITNFSFFLVDMNNKAIIHVFTDGTIEIYYNYSKDIVDYKVSTSRATIANTVKPYQIIIDNDNKRLAVLSIDAKTPHIKTYSYFFNADGSIQVPTLQKILPAPSSSPSTFMKLTTSNFEIQVPWQVVQYTKDTLQLKYSFRNSKIFYNSQSYLQFIQNGQSFIFISTHENISLYRWESTSEQLLLQFTFPLDYPILISYQVTSIQDIYFKIYLLGVSSGKFFNSNFLVPSNNQSGLQATLSQCYLQTPSVEYNFEVENQLRSLKSSQTQLGLSFTQTSLSVKFIQIKLILIYIFGKKVLGKKSFYYTPLMKYFKSSVVYTQNALNTDQETTQIDSSSVIQLDQQSFSRNQLEEIVIDGYTLNMFDTPQIKFHSSTTKMTWRSVKFVGNTNNFSFLVENFTQVTLKNIQIQNLQFTNKTILFQFINCTNIWIEQFQISGVNLYGNSQIFTFKDVQSITISQLNITSLNSNSDNSTLYPPISFSNVNKIAFKQSNFNKLAQTNLFSHLIIAKGILRFSISDINFMDSNRFGFINILNEYATDSQIVVLHTDVFTFKNSVFQNMQNLSESALLIKSQRSLIRNSTFSQINCQTCVGSVFNFYQSNNTYFYLTNFTEIIGQSGSAISYINCGYSNAKILSSNFLNCSSTAVGGAIFLDQSDLLINNTSIKRCSANIGGAIRYINLEPKFVYYNSIYQETKNPKYLLTNQISGNVGYIFGQNVGSYPKTIAIQPIITNYLTGELSQLQSLQNNFDDSSYNIQTFQLDSFQSGSEINFRLQILDQEDNPIRFKINDYLEGKYPQEINEEIEKFKIKVETSNESIKIFGQYATDYTQFNEEDNSFTINQMMIMSNPEQQNKIIFQSPSISKVINPTEDFREVSNGSFYVTLLINFRACIRGEVYKMSGSISYCYECKLGTYSLDKPDKTQIDQQVCKRCPIEASICYRDQMTLKEGYWKYNNDSDSILSCKNKPENCKGIEEKGYCVEGQIGPLCEQCDVYGKVWGNSYQNDGKFGCVACSKIFNALIMIPTILVGIGMIIYILISIRVALAISIKISTAYYLRFLKLIPISKSSYRDTTNMNMKAMMNFMQISSLINTFTVKLPEFMTFFPQYLGSPIQNLAYTFDCYLSKFNISKEMPLVYLRTIWTLVIPLFYLVGIGLAYSFLVAIRVSRFNKSQIISGLVFLLFFTQPNMITNILGVMSCRQIDGRYYILSDISYECYTTTHFKYIAIICFPGFVIYGFLIPLYILKQLIVNRNNLDYASVRLKYGFLYQDYKKSCFYWEFIKSYMKMIIIVILQFYGDPFNNKLVIILVILLLYFVALIRMKPYLVMKFQELEKTSIIIVIILLIINIFLYNKPDLVQQQLFYIFLIGLHNMYQLVLILDVFIANAKVMFPQKYNLVVKKLTGWIPILSQFISLQKSISFKTYINWKLIRKMTKEYAQKKKSSEVSLIQNNQISKDQSISSFRSCYSPHQPPNTIHPALSSQLNTALGKGAVFNNLYNKDPNNEYQIILSSFNCIDNQLSPNSLSQLSLREQVELINQTNRDKKSRESDDSKDSDIQAIKLARSITRKSDKSTAETRERESVIYKNLQPVPFDQYSFDILSNQLKIHQMRKDELEEKKQFSQRHIDIPDNIDVEELDEKLIYRKKITNHDFNVKAKENLIAKNLILVT